MILNFIVVQEQKLRFLLNFFRSLESNAGKVGNSESLSEWETKFSSGKYLRKILATNMRILFWNNCSLFGKYDAEVISEESLDEFETCFMRQDMVQIAQRLLSNLFEYRIDLGPARWSNSHKINKMWISIVCAREYIKSKIELHRSLDLIGTWFNRIWFNRIFFCDQKTWFNRLVLI